MPDLPTSVLPSLPSVKGAQSGESAITGRRPWWADAVVYEVYPRSFADTDGDGEGDLAGVRAKLPYLEELGVDAIWIAPWFPSPMADGGYDVSDYRDIDPRFGTLEDATALIAEADARGIRVIIDMVANHTSSEHPWFQAALAAPEGSPERARYLFLEGKGPDGALPPNNWISAFGGPAWSRTTNPDGSPGQWYMHMFAPEQPDLNWGNEQVQQDFDEILRFWFDRGVDGIRVDAAPAFYKTPGFPDADYGGDLRFLTAEWVGNPHWDVDEVHGIFKHWRRVADDYDGDRVLVAEAVVNGAERLGRYLAPDEIHTAFNFEFLKASWDPGLRRVIDDTLKVLAPVGSPPTWVLGSHDETRLVTRYGRANTGSVHVSDGQGSPSDFLLGIRRLRAAALLMLALPGGAYIYQGDELGLPDVEDIPDDRRQDPMWVRSGHTIRGRDGCRVPLPWSGEAPPFGFSPDDAATEPWLPQPAAWAALTVQAQGADPDSVLWLHRNALRLRREHAGFRTDAFSWRESASDVLDFERGDGLRCVVNLSGEPVALGAGWEVLLSSIPLEDGLLPHDATAWLKVQQAA